MITLVHLAFCVVFYKILLIVSVKSRWSRTHNPHCCQVPPTMGLPPSVLHCFNTISSNYHLLEMYQVTSYGLLCPETSRQSHTTRGFPPHVTLSKHSPGKSAVWYCLSSAYFFLDDPQIPWTLAMAYYTHFRIKAKLSRDQRIHHLVCFSSPLLADTSLCTS